MASPPRRSASIYSIYSVLSKGPRVVSVYRKVYKLNRSDNLESIQLFSVVAFMLCLAVHISAMYQATVMETDAVGGADDEAGNPGGKTLLEQSKTNVDLAQAAAGKARTELKTDSKGCWIAIVWF